ncbi:MAG: dTDP-4-dehydrorhamnose 3,5-epimerase [Rickettsiales bacterium]
MQLHDTELPEVKRITLDIFHDQRGFFCERFRADKFTAMGITENFVQTNHSRSVPGVIRGLHFQYLPMQGKLVGVTHGSVLDVALDVRPHSKNFGKVVTAELSEENAELLWIPPGFAHGFSVIGNRPADVVYYVTAHYNGSGESGIRLDDPALGIEWSTPLSRAILSPRDLAMPTLAEAKENLKSWFPT